MNATTLDAVDATYLRAFQKNLAEVLMRARVSLRTHLQQSRSLTFAEDLPRSFRQRYEEIADRLPLLIDSLGEMLGDLEVELSGHEIPPVYVNSRETSVSTETKNAFSMVEQAEREMLEVVNNVGESLESLPRSIISWDDCALVKSHVVLKRLPERPCYELDAPIDFFIRPFLIVGYFAEKNLEEDLEWPSFLIDEAVSIELLPLIEDLWIEIQVRGDGLAATRAQGGNGFGKLGVHQAAGDQ